MIRVLLVAALVTCTLGRERYEGWVKPVKPKNVDPLVWGECDADCGMGTRHESTRDWSIGCNNYPCDNPVACVCGDTDFLFVLDNTGSITQKNFYEAKHFIMDLMEGLYRYGGEMERSRVALITYDNFSYVEFDFNDGNTFADVPTFKDDIWEVEKQNGHTNTSGALWMAGEMVKSQQSSNKKVLIILTDGQSNIDESLVVTYATALHDAGIGVFVLGIGYTIDEAELRSIASKPEEKFYYYVESFALLSDITGPMLNGACCTIPPPSCVLHSTTECSATCGGGVYEETSACEHYGFGGVVVLNETVVETFGCNTDPCPTDVVCSHDDHTHVAPESWEEICTCNADGTTTCEEDEYDPHGDDTGDTDPNRGCRWAKVWHDPGTQWIQDVSGNRMKNCTCPDPPPSRWHIWTYCEAICPYDGNLYYGGDKFSYQADSGRWIDCECKIYAKLRCKLRKLTNDIATDPVLGCKWKTVWHSPGTTWIENVSGGRIKECACTDPPPPFWNIAVDCVARCDFEGSTYYQDDSIDRPDPVDGDPMRCTCTSNAQMMCNHIRSQMAPP